MENPKITVLMPVFNGEKYINQAVDSILNQTSKDFEFLIINDGSSDNTAEILRNYNDHRIRIIHNEKNIGLTRSLNKGIKLSQGEYIARMDADDISLPTRLERQVKFLQENMKIALLGTFSHLIDDKGRIIGGLYKPTDYHIIKKDLKHINSFVHGSVMIRKEPLLTIGKYDVFFKRAQDYDLWLRLSQEHPVVNLPEYLYKHRIHNESIEIKYRKEQIMYCLLALIKNDNSTVDILADELIGLIIKANLYHRYSLPNVLSWISRITFRHMGKIEVYRKFYHLKFKKYINDFRYQRKNLDNIKMELKKTMEKI